MAALPTFITTHRPARPAGPDVSGGALTLILLI